MTNPSSTNPAKFKLKDPFAEREAGKYERPIPSRELILEMMKEQARPLNLDEVAAALGVTEEDDLESLRRRLQAMERDGQLLRNRRERYCVVNRKDLTAGRVLGHADGFGFLRPDDGGEDLFLSPREMRALMPGDRIVASVTGIDRRGRREGAVVEILERNTQRVVGRLYIERGIAFVVPEQRNINHDILIPESAVGEARNGQIVVVEIIEQPTLRREPIGRVTEVLGDHMAPGMEIEVAIRSYDLPNVWSEAVLAEVAPFEGQVAQDAHPARVDLRHLPLVTIDGEDARDFDDAVYCERTPKGWKLYVAIADVSHYVRPRSALDNEALLRGNSVYFPQRVIPMLPEILSNGLCSLNPDEDRLCMVCEMSVNVDGTVIRSQFYRGLMRSQARLTYTEVAKILVDSDKHLRRARRHLVPHLEELFALYKRLRWAREERGAIDFESRESKIIFGEGKKIESIVAAERNDAHRLIEECMILANQCAARFLARSKLPHLLRVHDGPSAEKLADLRAFLGEVGLSLEGGDSPEPIHYFQVLDKIVGRVDEHLIQTVLLRSLSQAVYSPEKKGHFGLALPAYTHFTSPIRRYPDLLTHRAIVHAIDGGKADTFEYALNDVLMIGEQCSSTERRADEATRGVVSWLKCEYMLDKVGQTFDGVVSAVTSFGLFVELREIFIEGLVHISSLDKDYFHYDPVGHRLVGERTGVRYRLGDPVRVTVVRVDLDDRKIDLEPAAKASRQDDGVKKRRRR
ncbi:ribonuclease R [Methylotetracoccus oryzae]|uniref:ribonuclease R n=1 Tax=Methylotetracoccus oryzae TaxID=1919059 RepID=UPI001118CBEC|nr:ribonuclease R [Methylotetracoccus oryzae]